MNKKIQLILEFLAKCKTVSSEKQDVYKCILHELSEEILCAKTIFTCKQIKTLLKGEINSSEEAERFFKKHLLKNENKKLVPYLDNIFMSLISSNFPTHAHLLKLGTSEFEASLDKVEAKIYMMIKTYIQMLRFALGLYVYFDEKRQKELSEIVEFAKNIHACILKHMFYEEEIALLNNSLEQLLSVYVGVYFNFCYCGEAK